MSIADDLSSREASPESITNRSWLAALLLRQDSPIAARFALFYHRLRALPHSQRRTLRRRLALTVTGAALLLALGPDPTGFGKPVRSYAAPAVPAAITVANGVVYVNPKDGLCALSEAIANTIDYPHGNGHIHNDCAPGNPAGADTIVLPPGGDFPLRNELTYAYFNSIGLPVIWSEVTIMGNGATIRRDPASQHALNLLTVSPRGRLTVNNVIFAGGRSRGRGGAIHALGPLTVRNSVFLNNTGSAIRADFTSLTVEHSKFAGNSGDFGGGILAFHTDLTLKDSTITGSSAAWGSAVYVRRGTVIIDGTVFENNVTEATKYGGALFLGDTPGATISHSRFTNNRAPIAYRNRDVAGGAITVNSTGWDVNSQVVISDSILNGNSAMSGGGLYIRGDEVTVRETTISGNRAVYGGGIRAKQCHLRLENSTLSGNEAFLFVPPEGEGPVYGGTGGGLLASELYEVLIYNSTIAGNQADTAGGGVWGGYWIDAFVAKRVLITGNSAPQGPQMTFIHNLTDITGGFNLFGADGDAGIDGFTPGPSDIVPAAGVTVVRIIDPVLAANFGLTPTHALPLGSPAIDAAPSVQCDGKHDQRGIARNADGDDVPSDNECDIGAFERGPGLDQQAFLPFIQRANP